MTVNPGFGGQAFIRSVCEKVRRIKAMVGGRDIDIEIDGGVTPETAPLVAEPAPTCWSRARPCSRAAHPPTRQHRRSAGRRQAGEWTYVGIEHGCPVKHWRRPTAWPPTTRD